MNFFENKRHLNRGIFFLYGLFIFNILIALVAVNLIVAYVDQTYFMPSILVTSDHFLFYTQKSIIAAGLTLAIILFNYVKTRLTIRTGNDIMNSLAAVLVTGRQDHLKLVQLNQVVAELAIASGIRVPAIYLIDTAESINALAAGSNRKNCAIAVTKGALELERDELQALIAHEMGHIVSGDMQINMQLVAVLSSFMALSSIGFLIMAGSGAVATGAVLTKNGDAREKGAGATLALGLFILGLAFIVLGGGLYMIGRMIQSLISVNREYHADNHSVILLRGSYPMMSLLGKIEMESPYQRYIPFYRKELEHFLFTNLTVHSFFLFRTHPPIKSRLKAVSDRLTEGEMALILENRGEERKREDERKRRRRAEREERREALAVAKDGEESSQVKTHSILAAQLMSAANIVSDIENSTSSENTKDGAINQSENAEGSAVNNMSQMGELFKKIPPLIMEYINLPDQVDLLFYALIISDDKIVQRLQLSVLDSSIRDDVEEIHETLKTVDLMTQYLIGELAYPALKQLSHVELKPLLNNFQSILKGYDKLDYRQIVLSLSLEKMINELIDGSGSLRIRRTNFSLYSLQMSGAIHGLLSALILSAEYSDEKEQNRVFQKAMRRIYPNNRRQPTRIINFDWMTHLKSSLEIVENLPLNEQHKVMESALALVFDDGEVMSGEYELLRLYGLYLDYDIPIQLTDVRYGMDEVDEVEQDEITKNKRSLKSRRTRRDRPNEC